MNATTYARAFYQDTAPRRRSLTNMRRGVRRNCQWLLRELQNEGILSGPPAKYMPRRTLHAPLIKRPVKPAWADERAIQVTYQMARRVSDCLGVKFHVDHIVPFKGRRVCGLHVEYNLQVIPAILNQRKWNRCQA